MDTEEIEPLRCITFTVSENWAEDFCLLLLRFMPKEAIRRKLMANFKSEDSYCFEDITCWLTEFEMNTISESFPNMTEIDKEIDTFLSEITVEP